VKKYDVYCNIYKLEYSPYTTPVTKVLKFVNFVVKEKLEESLVKILLKLNQKLTEELPEDLRELICGAKIRKIIEGEAESLKYLTERLKKTEFFS